MGAQVGNTSEKLLPDIVLVRLFLIAVLVLYHSMCPFTGGWGKFEGQTDIPAYGILGVILYSCLLETWVFVSGYVFGHQVKTKGEDALSFRNCIWRKFKRLMIPSILFSILYCLIISPEEFENSAHIIIYRTTRGYGHLWFLPMLFWCFIFIFIFEKLKISWKIILPALLISAVFSKSDMLGFRFGNATYYMFFFYLGYVIKSGKISSRDIHWGGKTTYWSAVTYILLFVVARFISDKINLAQSFVTPLYPAYDIPSNILIMSYSLPGVLFIMNFANRILENSAVQVSPIIVKLSGLTFGAYLIQEFILRIFYYKSTLISFVPSFLAPWTAAIISITLSVALTYLFQRAKKRIKLCRQ